MNQAIELLREAQRLLDKANTDESTYLGQAIERLLAQSSIPDEPSGPIDAVAFEHCPLPKEPSGAELPPLPILCWVRTLDGEIDWSEDCLNVSFEDCLSNYDDLDEDGKGYSAIALVKLEDARAAIASRDSVIAERDARIARLKKILQQHGWPFPTGSTHPCAQRCDGLCGETCRRIEE